MSIAVIGGGPAGLMAAIAAAEGGDVVLFEKKETCGRKLLLSGSGQCNLTHAGSIPDFLDRYGTKNRFVKPALYAFGPDRVLDFFRERGVEFETDGNGKIFPKSRKAREILGVLLDEAKKTGVRMQPQTPVSEVSCSGEDFHLKLGNGEIRRFRKLIIATGGASFPVTGSNGDGWTFAEFLGHRIIETRPALTDIIVSSFPLAGCSGISFSNASVAVFRSGKKILQANGELLLTHKGFSGPLILNNSRSFSPGDQFFVDFTGAGERFRDELITALNSDGGRSLLNVLRGFHLPERLLKSLMEQCGVDSGCRAAELKKENRKLVIKTLTSFEVPVSSLGGYEKAMATAGGVDVSEVNPKTMESRLCPGLYFAGEVLDVDGDTGGFNIQWALSSGYVAGHHASSL